MTNERTAIEILSDIIRLSDSLTEDTGTPKAMQVVEMLDKCIEEGRELLAGCGNPFVAPCARCREIEDIIESAEKLLTQGKTNEH